MSRNPSDTTSNPPPSLVNLFQERPLARSQVHLAVWSAIRDKLPPSSSPTALTLSRETPLRLRSRRLASNRSSLTSFSKLYSPSFQSLADRRLSSPIHLLATLESEDCESKVELETVSNSLTDHNQNDRTDHHHDIRRRQALGRPGAGHRRPVWHLAWPPCVKNIDSRSVRSGYLWPKAAKSGRPGSLGSSGHLRAKAGIPGRSADQEPRPQPRRRAARGSAGSYMRRMPPGREPVGRVWMLCVAAGS